MVRIPRLLAVATLALFAAPALAQAPIKIVGLVELSGTGATSGTNFDNGVKLAVKEINAAGGILGRQVQYTSGDTQGDVVAAACCTRPRRTAWPPSRRRHWRPAICPRSAT
mgnify:CR=1 FL=1